MRRAAPLAWAVFAALAACKPPATDEAQFGAAPTATPSPASSPLPSPQTEGAVWAESTQSENRIVYGVPGEPALLALSCARDGERGAGTLTIARYAPADDGAGALLALVGNGNIGRIAVDATKVGKAIIWQGSRDAASEKWEPLAGPRKIAATVPGAGTVALNPSPLPMRFVERCRKSP